MPDLVPHPSGKADPTRRQYVLGDIADEAKLRELALRWASHPDYPQPRHG